MPLRQVAEAENSCTLRHLADYQDNPSKDALIALYANITTRLKDKYRGNAHLDLTAQVLEYGATKYEPGNWKRADRKRYRQEYLSATCRHLYPSAGEEIDPESGLPHLAHACCNVLMLLWMEEHIGDGEYDYERMERECAI